jgi:hypothetical protein
MPLKYLSNLGCRFPADLIAATLKLGERRTFKVHQFTLHFFAQHGAVIRHATASRYPPKVPIAQCKFQ